MELDITVRPLQRVGVMGAGAWGTALAQSLRRAGRDVVLWARDPELAREINAGHVNERRLPGVRLDAQILATSSLADLAGCDLLLLTIPAQQLRTSLELLASAYFDGTPLIICAKGLEQGTLCRMTDVAAQVLKASAAVLSGPSFAHDVARGLPTAVTLAAADLPAAERLAQVVGHRFFRVYASDDLTGVQIGGAVKNVLAIAAGILVGRRLGASAHAALVTRAFRELTRFAEQAGARRETLIGLSCFGDLMLTCNSPLSRNFSVGRNLGSGMTLNEAMADTAGTIEGVYTAIAVEKMARNGTPPIDMPIATAVYNIVSGHQSVDDAIDTLLSRPQRSEC